MGAAKNHIPLDDVDAMRATLEEVARTDNVEALIQLVLKILVNLTSENKRLALRLQNAMRSLHGRKSEKLSSGQLDLFRKLLNEQTTENGKDAEEDGDEGGSPERTNGNGRGKPNHKKGKGKSHGRNKFPDNLPRFDNFIPVPDDERDCRECGTQKKNMGQAVSERLDYVPASLRVVRDIREKLVCKTCQGSVSIAPVAPHLIEGGMASEGLLAHVLVSKYVDGLPLFRLSKIYGRYGFKVPESTLGDMVRQTALHLTVLGRHIRERVMSSFCVQQDDTGIAVLDKEHPSGIKRGHIYANVGDGFVFYHYAPNWRGEHPTALLHGYTGIVQGDGYPGINEVFSRPDAQATRAGCMMHCRRYFFRAHKAGDRAAEIPLALCTQLYELEALAKEKQFTSAQITELRAKKSLPIMTRLRNYIDKISPVVPPKSEMGKAITYTRNQWPHLLVPFSDGRMAIDNGEAERQLRLLAVGRRNWLFAGSDQGGEHAAAALTVLGTAIWQGVDPLAYLTDVLRRIASGHPSSRIAELLPAPWAQQHGQQISAQAAPLPKLVE